MTASSVSPPAIRTEARAGAPLDRLVRNEPTATAGQSRRPRSTSTASAMPVSSQTTEICFEPDASCSAAQPAP